MDRKWRIAWWIISVVSLTLIIAAFCIGYSVDSVNENEYGLLFRGFSQSIDQNHYDIGRYLVGIGNRFITFPSKLISVRFEQKNEEEGPNFINCHTNQGQSLTLDSTILLILTPQDTTNSTLYNFYSKFGDSWLNAFTRYIYSDIQSVVSNYSITSFISNKTTVVQTITNQINQTVSLRSLNILKLYSFQLHSVKFDKLIESAIKDKLVETQNVKINQIQLQISSINKNIEQLLNKSDSDQALINADAKAYSKMTEYNAYYQSLANEINSDASIYQSLDKDLSMSSDGTLFNFIIAYEQMDLKGRVVNGFSQSVASSR